MTDPAPLAAPATEAAGLTLDPPEAVAPVAAEKVAGMVTLDQAALPGLDAKVAGYVESLASLDVRSPDFSAKATDVRTMGDDEIRQAAETSNRLLQAPVRAMERGGLSDTSKVANSLTDLRRTVEDLDPSDAKGVRKLLGIIPFGDKLRDYFARYESAQKHLDAIIKALQNGQDELRKDNAALEQEKVHLWATMQRLGQYIYIAGKLDAALVTKVAEAELSDPERAKALREDVLFYVRQKHQDLLTQLAVSVQGYLAIDMVRKNNLELIKGVDRATTTTVAALRTAVVVAQALANQKLVLDQIDALNTTTSKMIQTTSELLASQSVDIQRQAASSTVSVEALQAAFANIYRAMDAVDAYKAEALGAMSTTIGSLETEIDKAQSYLARVRQSEARSEATDLDLDS
jgi:uncharacterized protein YaaN involved in tellurite resistance